MIFFIRFITATCLFAFLGKANVWLNPISNIILAIGYRFFLILSPLFSKVAGKYAVALSLLIAALGALLFSHGSFYLSIIGAVLVGIGLSVSGYLIKSEATETPSGAAYNKIALNVGSLLSGLILLVSFKTKSLFFGLGSLALLLGFVIAILGLHKQKQIQLPVPKTFTKVRFVGWLLIGVAIGIKLFGVFSVLPQYLISKNGHLPSWYGIMVFVNSGVIIVCQLHVINFIEKFKANQNSFKITVAIMLLGMLIIAFPQVFFAQIFLGALAWTIILSLVECCASYLDVEGSRAGFLLVKETCVGLGAGLTVLINRYLEGSLSSLSTGLLGFIVILAACFLLRKDLFIKHS